MNNKQKGIIYSAFPGTGKSFYYNKYLVHSDRIILDSDSSKFDKSKFPENYMNHIKDNINKAHIMFVSSHEEVRNALVANALSFTLIYPHISLKDEYIERYKDRGNSSLFIKLMNENWERWILGCQEQLGCKHIVLPSMIFINDVI